MLIVSGIISVTPEHHDQMVELIGPLVEATLAEEGNVTYGFWASPTEPLPTPIDRIRAAG